MITLTVFTSKKPARLSKRFTLVGGVPIKESGGNMTQGVAQRLTVNPEEFARLLPTLKPNQAACYGVSDHEQAQVFPKETIDKAGSDLPTIARTRDDFHWPEGPGVLMLDYDPAPDGPPLARDDLIDALATACPELNTAPMAWRPSASSCIYAGEQELVGVAGQRVYVFVLDARDIPRAGQALVDRLWLAGYGRYELSKSGAFLARTTIDASVFQPERLDFCGGADCGKGLVQKLPDPVLFNADAPYLDTTRIADLTPTERQRIEDAQAELRLQLGEEQARVRESWIESRVQDRISRLPEPERTQAAPVLERVYRAAANGGWLPPDFELTVVPKGSKQRKALTVRETLLHRKKYHEATTLDPLEPDYPAGQGRLVGWLNLNAKPPYLQSQAHGGTRYLLGEGPVATAVDPILAAQCGLEPERDTGAPQAAVWQARCQTELPKTLVTVFDLLENDPKLVFGYNAFRQCIEKRDPPPWNADVGAWTDRDSVELMMYLERTTGTAFGRDLVDLAVIGLSHRNPFNPAQDHLRALADQWDGTSRLRTWLVDYVSAAVSDGNCEYLAEIGEKWLKGVVARVLYPGCKRDDVLVLRGPQGWFKSTVAEAVSATVHPEAFTDSIDLGNLAEAKIQIRGIIVAELGELAGLAKGEVEAIKAFVSTKSDHFREKFGKFAQDYPRTVSFIGSTNDQSFLKDPTGNRRWWPVTLASPIDIPRAKAILPQLVGEAARRVLSGESWFVSNKDALAQAEQVREAHYDQDVWTDAVMRFVDAAEANGVTITSAEVLDALNIPRHQQSTANQRRVAGILKVHGYEEARQWVDKGKTRRIRIWKKSTHTRDPVPSGHPVPTSQTAGKRGDRMGTGCEDDPVPNTPETHEGTGWEGHPVPIRSTESLGKHWRGPGDRMGPDDSYRGEIDEKKKTENPGFSPDALATRILNTLAGCPGGMTQEDLARLVGNSKGDSPAMVEMVLVRLMKEGAIGKLNGRLVVNL